jgi:uncharacterized protein (DUF433 family)
MFSQRSSQHFQALANTQLTRDGQTVAESVGTATKSRRKSTKKSATTTKSTAALDQARRVEFESFSVSFRDEVDPKGVLETIQVNRTILSAWRLREAIEAERAGILGGLRTDRSGKFEALSEDLHRQTNRAERGFLRAFRGLLEIRDASQMTWGKAIQLDTRVVDVEPIAPCDDEIMPNEWTIVPYEDRTPEPVSDPNSPLPRWQDRLVVDANVSVDSPTVKGTWITVSQIVTLIVDGYTWADILRTHPELTEEDIRICLSYATETENRDGDDLLQA